MNEMVRDLPLLPKPMSSLQASKLTNGERQTFITSLVVGHARFNDTLATLARWHYPVKGGVRNYGKIAVIQGDARTGKSFACEQYMKRFPITETGSGISKPVIMAATPESGGLRPLANVIADAMGLLVSQRINTIGLVNAIIDVLPKIGCEMLIIDEFQENEDLRHPRKQKDVLGFLKRIVDRSKVLVVVAGLKGTRDLLASDPQILGRGNLPTHTIPHYEWERDKTYFKALLGAIDALLPFPEMSNLQDDWLASRLNDVSAGLIGRLMEYVYQAACIALNEEAPRILPHHFAEYHRDTMGEAVTANPFE